KIDPNILNIALLLASWNSDTFGTQRLLQTYNVDVDFKDLKGRTGLHFACLNGDHFTTKLLLRHNARTHIWDNAEKATPLHCAAGIEKKSALHIAVQRNAINC
ncbi:unnamed protein product, partial [Sphagnum compactum]